MSISISLGMISIVISLLVTGFNAAMLIVVKFNDLKHLELAVLDLKKIVEDNTKAVNKLSNDFSAQHATCEERHKK